MIYIAGSFDARDRLRGVRSMLQEDGWTVKSTWLDEEGDHDGMSLEQMAALAKRDLMELSQASFWVMDTVTPSSKGGSYCEFGAMMGLVLAGHPRPVIVVGPVRNIFLATPIHQFDSWTEGRTFLQGVRNTMHQAGFHV